MKNIETSLDTIKECDNCHTIFNDDRSISVKRTNCRYWQRKVPCPYKDELFKSRDIEINEKD